MFAFTVVSTFHRKQGANSGARRVRGTFPVCTLESKTQQTDNSTTSEWDSEWKTDKVRAHRPMRGVRRGSQRPVHVQGRPRRNAPARMPPRVRITSGSARGRKLTSPNVHLRPMMGRVREAVFSMLDELGALRSDGAALDLFAGLGSVGLEALSRGMRNGVFVDSAPACVSTIRDNAAHCGLADRSNVVCDTVESFLPKARAANNNEPFALITVTPPYEEVVYSDLLTMIATSDAVGEGTFVVVEYPLELKELPPAIEHRLIGVRNRRYGRTIIAIYACQPSIHIDLRPDEFVYKKRAK